MVIWNELVEQRELWNTYSTFEGAVRETIGTDMNGPLHILHVSSRKFALDVFLRLVVPTRQNGWGLT